MLSTQIANPIHAFLVPIYKYDTTYVYTVQTWDENQRLSLVSHGPSVSSHDHDNPQSKKLVSTYWQVAIAALHRLFFSKNATWPVKKKSFSSYRQSSSSTFFLSCTCCKARDLLRWNYMKYVILFVCMQNNERSYLTYQIKGCRCCSCVLQTELKSLIRSGYLKMTIN